MKNRLMSLLLGFLVLSLCVVWAAPTAQAAGDDTTYVISFRPGENGSFDDAKVSNLSSIPGVLKVQKTAAGNVFLEAKSGTQFPAEILNCLTTNAGYYYKGGLAGTAINGDATYVVEYGILSGAGVMYTVRYVDSTSGAELAESYTGYAIDNETITFAARAIAGYDVDSVSKSLTVHEGAELTFLYTSNGSLNEIQYEYGPDTIIQNNPVDNVDNDDNDNDDNADNNPDDNAENNPDDNGEEIDDNDVPLNNGGDNASTEPAAPETEPEEIEDNDTPLAPGVPSDPTKDGNGLVIGITVGTLALLALAAAAVVVLKKRR